jgi:pyruvate formate-lyase activating enzyme-like uncharacterized protein
MEAAKREDLLKAGIMNALGTGITGGEPLKIGECFIISRC